MANEDMDSNTIPYPDDLSETVKSIQKRDIHLIIIIINYNNTSTPHSCNKINILPKHTLYYILILRIISTVIYNICPPTPHFDEPTPHIGTGS